MSYVAVLPPALSRVLVVDSKNGNDARASAGGTPFATVNAAITASTAGDVIWVTPGTYELSSAITLKDNTSLRGMSTQNTTLQMTNVTSNTTLLTMGENCRVEDLTLSLTSAGHYTLIGIDFPGTTCVTSKIRPAVINVNNSSASDVGTSNVYGVRCSGTGTLGSASFSFNSLKSLTINVKSAGSGSKRGIYVSGSGTMTTRDVNVYVSGSSTSPGTFYGAEVDNSSGQLQVRSTTLFGTTADIRQTSGSITIGPGTDLINKTAGDKNFTTYIVPNILFYGCIGALSSAYDPIVSNYTAYLAPGACPVQSPSTSPRIINPFPDPNINYYSVQQKSIAYGLFLTASTGPGANGNSTKVVVMKNGVDTVLTGTLTDSILSVRNYDGSINFNQFDLMSLRLEYTGSTNTTHDLFCQVDMF